MQITLDKEELDYTSNNRIGILAFCPEKYNLDYNYNLKFTGNVPSCFGNASHKGLEGLALGTKVDVRKYFIKKLKKLDRKFKSSKQDRDLIKELLYKGDYLVEEAFKFIKEQFPEYEIVHPEKELLLPIKTFKGKKSWYFNGVLDLLLKHKEKDHYIIIDYKTCSWGWKIEKKNDRMTTNQLAYYKYFITEELGISNPKQIDTYFVLIKYGSIDLDENKNIVPKINKKTGKPYIICELIKTSSGTIKTNRALKVLNSTLRLMDENLFPKNLNNCGKCDHYFNGNCSRSPKFNKKIN